jgi:hypothetical protein
MSTAVMPESRSVPALARVEAKRLARHPFFVVGVVACAVLLSTSLGTGFDYYNVAVIPGFFVGLFSMVAMFRLAGSMQRTEEALGSVPASAQDRTRALCWAALLPAALGVVCFLAILAFAHGSEPNAYGAFSRGDRVAIFFGEVVVACVGGPLLGVAAGRWLRFPGALAVVVVAVLFLVMLGVALTSAARNAWWSTLARMLSPWTQFSSVDSAKNELESWRGSPWWYLGWIVALCVLAVLGALLKDAEGEQRSRLVRTGLAVGLLGLACALLAVALGPDHATLYAPNGISRI